MNPTDQASKLVFGTKFLWIYNNFINRKGSEKTGIKEKQEAEANGPASCIKRERSDADIGGIRKN